MRIILLGPPGIGKQAHAKVLAKHYSLPVLATAEMLRQAVRSGTEVGLAAKAYLDVGQHVPDEVLFPVFRDCLEQPEMRLGFLLVGFPRTTLQADLFDSLLEEMKMPLDLVLQLEVEADLLMERLEGLRTCISCGHQYNVYTNPPMVDEVCDHCGGKVKGRVDNNEATVSNRIRIYEQHAASLAQFYKVYGKLQQVDGGANTRKLRATLRKAIDEALENKSKKVVQPEEPVEVPSPPGSKERFKKKEAPRKESKPKKKAVAKKTASKKTTKKAAVKKKSPAKKTTSGKSSVKKKTAAKKVYKKGTAAKKKVVQKKKSVTKEKAVSKKRVPAKKRVVKKKTVAKKSAKKPAVKKKTSSKKKAPARKPLTKKKRAAAKPSSKKIAAKKKAPVKKKVATKKKVVKKKRPAKKRR